MATQDSKGSTVATSSAGSISVKTRDWSSIVPRVVGHEDALSDSVVSGLWQKLYAAAGMATAGEEDKSAFRLGVYMYACVNGTSRVGNYASDIQLHNGRKFNASIIPTVVGTTRLRKFFRGNMEESYQALKESGAMATDSRFVAKVSKFGVGPDEAFATSDWMTDCSLFTPLESAAHTSSFNRSIERARRARDGRTLEQVEKEVVDHSLRVNGPEHVDGGINGHSF